VPRRRSDETGPDGRNRYGCDLGPAEMTARDMLAVATRGGAQVLGRDDIGHLAPGMAADLVIFDPAQVRARATYVAPLQLAEGFDLVLVNGRVARDAGVLDATLHGEVLKPDSAVR
jgi:cytosine/adenosine deaminase-related metal-dependent hydrolase